MNKEMMLKGTIKLPNGTVDVTDPCYNAEVWCRKTLNVKKGVYNCYFYIGGENDPWGKRVHVSRIVNNECIDIDKKEWLYIDYIGVDAGLAGFFDQKSDYTDTEWTALCEYMDECEKTDGRRVYLTTFDSGRDGYWTESGYGDGSYGIYGIKNEQGEWIALELRFEAEEDSEE